VQAQQFPIAMRGYDRAAVDAWREEVAELVARLESEPPRDAAVKRALDQVGEETAAILQRAHESADEIEARSRSKADARIDRAEGEAEITIREAEERAERLDEDIRGVWDQRVRLIEEMRQLADEMLGVADDALERLAPPGGRQLHEEPFEAAGEEVFEGDPESAPPRPAAQDTRVIRPPGGETQPFDAGPGEDTDEVPSVDTDEAPAVDPPPPDRS